MGNQIKNEKSWSPFPSSGLGDSTIFRLKKHEHGATATVIHMVSGGLENPVLLGTDERQRCVLRTGITRCLRRIWCRGRISVRFFRVGIV